MRSKSIVVAFAAGLLASGGLASAAADSQPLLRAAANSDVSAVRALLKQHVDVNAAEADGTTALHIALEHHSPEIAAMLLDAGSNARATTRYGITPLYIACLHGDSAIVEKLLIAGAPVDTALPEGETALMTASRTGSVGVVRILLLHGAKTDARENWKGQTALMWAAAENNVGVINELVKAGADVNARAKSGTFSAYLFAVRAGHIEAARALLDAGVNVNDALPDGTSALTLAIMNAHFETAAFLLDRGSDPNADKQGWAPLHQLVWSRRPNTGSNIPGAVPTGNLDSLELARKLLDAGADVNAREKREPKDGFRNMLNRIGATPFLLAAKSVDVPLMRVLLEYGADPKLTTEDRTTALMAAAGVGIWAPGENPGTDDDALAAVKLAYEVGGGSPVDVDANGETALHGAMYRAGSIAIAKFLLEKGAKPDVVNKKGWTPLMVADGVEYTPNVLKRYPETAAFLRQALAERGLAVPAPLDSPPSAKGQQPAAER